MAAQPGLRLDVTVVVHVFQTTHQPLRWSVALRCDCHKSDASFTPPANYLTQRVNMVDVANMDITGPSGYSLSVPERSSLQISMIQRTREENLESPLRFWGKIMGVENDYLICTTTRRPTLEEGEFPVKLYYFSTSSSPTLRQMPQLSREYENLAKAKTGRFKGDPSLPLDEEPEEEVNDEGEPIEKERFREMHRLAYVVSQIEHDVSIVPRGAYIVEASRKIAKSNSYQGLSYKDAGQRRNYYHFRPPESANAIAALTRKGLVRSADFLDPIVGDNPRASWSISYNPSHTHVLIKSHAWPGYYFINETGAPQYASVYFGYGLQNPDLSVML